MEDTKLIFNFNSTAMPVFIVPLLQTALNNINHSPHFHQTISSSTKMVIMQSYFKAKRVININHFQLNIKKNTLSVFESSIIILS